MLLLFINFIHFLEDTIKLEVIEFSLKGQLCEIDDIVENRTISQWIAEGSLIYSKGNTNPNIPLLHPIRFYQTLIEMKEDPLIKIIIPLVNPVYESFQFEMFHLQFEW